MAAQGRTRRRRRRSQALPVVITKPGRENEDCRHSIRVESRRDGGVKPRVSPRTRGQHRAIPGEPSKRVAANGEWLLGNDISSPWPSPASRVRAPPLSIHGFADLPVALCRHPLRGLGPPPLSISRVRGLPRGFMPSPAARVGPHRLNPSCALSNDLRAPVGYLSSCPSKKPKAKEAASTREWVNAEKGKEAVN